jgi:hypothetical protein
MRTSTLETIGAEKPDDLDAGARAGRIKLRLIEAAAASAILAGLLTGILVASGQDWMLSRPFWLDEILTAILTSDPDVAHSMTALAHGADTNPPVRYLLLRMFAMCYPGTPEFSYRLFAVGSLWAAGVGAYLLCRRFAEPLAAMVAAAALCTHPVALGNAVEIRFYTTLLAAAVWFCYALVLIKTPGHAVAKGIFLAVASALLCTMHYFGAAMMFPLIVAGDWLGDGRPARVKAIGLLPALAGPVALLACAPFYFGQRDAVHGTTWIERLNADQITQVFGQIFFILPVAIVLGVFLIAVVVGWLMRWIDARRKSTATTAPAAASASDSQRTSARPAPRVVAKLAAWFAGPRGGADHPPVLGAMAGMSALLLLPVVLMLFSWLVQPAFLTKYAIGALAGMVPLTAYLASRMGRVFASILLVLLIGAGVWTMSNTLWIFNGLGTLATAVQTMNQLAGVPEDPRPFVFVARAWYYPAACYSPIAPRSCLLGLSDAQLASEPEFVRNEMFNARAVNRFYPKFRMADLAELKRNGPFFLVMLPYEYDQLKPVLTGLKVRQLSEILYDVRAAKE